MVKKLCAAALILSAAIFMVSCVTIVKTGEEGTLTGEVAFNAGDNVAEIWTSSALPNLQEKAVDLAEFLREADGNLKSLANRYGKYSMGDSGELSYTVRGTAVVKEVVTDKKAGYLLVDLEDYDGAETIKLQIGTVYKGSAVRDSLDFICFEDYKNQVDYAAVSQSIHDLLQHSVIDAIDISSLQGKQISFLGCFTVNQKDELLITPVELTVH